MMISSYYVLHFLPIVDCELACHDHQDTTLCMDDNMIHKKGKSVLGSRPYRQCSANCKALCFLVCALLHERKGMSRERTEDTNTDKHRTR